MSETNTEYDNFAALLTRIVTTPKTITDAREKEIEDVKAWRKKHGMPQKRERITSGSKRV